MEYLIKLCEKYDCDINLFIINNQILYQLGFRIALSNGYIDIAKWLFETSGQIINIHNEYHDIKSSYSDYIFKTNLFEELCTKQKIEEVKWLWNISDKTIKFSNNVLKIACNSGNIELYDWLCDIIYNYENIISDNVSDLLLYCVSHNSVNNNLEMVKHLYNNKNREIITCDTYMKLSEGALLTGQYEIAKWAFDKINFYDKININIYNMEDNMKEMIITNAIYRDDVRMLEWFYKELPDFGNHIMGIKYFGPVEPYNCVYWLYDNIPLFIEKLKKDNRIFVEFINDGNIKLAKYIWDITEQSINLDNVIVFLAPSRLFCKNKYDEVLEIFDFVFDIVGHKINHKKYFEFFCSNKKYYDRFIDNCMKKNISISLKNYTGFNDCIDSILYASKSKDVMYIINKINEISNGDINIDYKINFIFKNACYNNLEFVKWLYERYGDKINIKKLLNETHEIKKISLDILDYLSEKHENLFSTNHFYMKIFESRDINYFLWAISYANKVGHNIYYIPKTKYYPNEHLYDGMFLKILFFRNHNLFNTTQSKYLTTIKQYSYNVRKTMIYQRKYMRNVFLSRK
jgi:hypothetical protein